MKNVAEKLLGKDKAVKVLTNTVLGGLIISGVLVGRTISDSPALLGILVPSVAAGVISGKVFPPKKT